MAVSAITGLITAASGALAAGGIASMTFLGLSGMAAFGAMFAVGAGIGVLSKAMMPKPDLGAQLRGTTNTVREPAGSRKVIYGELRVGGNVVFINHEGTDNEFLHLAIVFAPHEIESYEEIWFNDKRIWTTSGFANGWNTYVTMDQKLGSATQAASEQLKNSSTLWTNDHKLSNIAYVAFKLKWNRDRFPQGVPNITAVIKGKKVYDPRLDTTEGGSGSHRANDPSTWEYSSNPALCVRDYLTDKKYGLGEDYSTVNIAALKAAANNCDTTGDYSTATQKRFECHGRLDTTNQIKANIEQLLASMGGKITYSGGEYFVDAAHYKTPTVTIDDSVVISAIKVQTKQSRSSKYNSVKGTFLSEEKNYKVLDYPAQTLKTVAGSFVSGTTYQILTVGTTDFTAIGAASNTVGLQFTATGAGTGTGTASSSVVDDGELIFLDVPLPFVTSNVQAQRLAKISLLKSRQQTVIQMTVNLAGLKIKVGDVINVTNTKLGYSSKKFEVIGYQLSVKPDGMMGVQLECIETASSIYDFTSADEQDFLSGGELDLYDGRTVDNVTFTANDITEIGLRGPDGGLVSAVQLSWTAPDDAFIEFYTVRYNKNGTTDYFEVQTRETNALIEGLDLNSNYDFTVKAQNLIGVQSSGTTVNNFDLSGDVTIPGLPTNTSATGGIQTITAEWSNPNDIDFKHVEVFVNTTDSIPGTPTALVDGEEYIVTGLSGAQQRYFWLKSVDFSGNKSDATSSFSGTSVVATTADIDEDDILYEVPSEGLTYYWPCNSITDVSGDGNEELQEVVSGKTGIHSGSLAPTLSTDSPTGKSVVNGTSNSGFTLLSDTDADALEGAEGFAWSIWFKSDTSSGDGAARIIGRDASDGWAVIINQGQTGNQNITLYGEPSTEAMGAVAQGEWHHFCLSEDGNGTISGYVNGELVGTESYTPVNSSRPVVIGCNTEETIAPQASVFEGKLTEIRAYNRALTPQEVRGLYKVPAASAPAEVDGDMIVDGSLFAAKLNVDQLSAIAADLGAITAGTLQNSGSDAIPSNIFTRSSNRNIPTGDESGAFIDLATGAFVFGNAATFLSFANNTTVTPNAFELDLKGVLSPTVLNLSGVSDETVMPPTIKAQGYVPLSVPPTALSDEVWNQIDGLIGQAGTGFYVSTSGVYLGEAQKIINLGSTPNHRKGDITVAVVVADSFSADVDFAAGSDPLKLNITLQYKLASESDYSNAVTISTTSGGAAGAAQKPANPKQVLSGTVYSINESITVTLTSGAGQDIADDVDLDFRVILERVGSQSAFATVANGGANDTDGTPVTLQVSEGAAGVVATAGDAETLDGIESTGFLRLGTSSSTVDNNAFGNQTFTGDVTVTGTLNLQGSIDQYNVTDLEVVDKTISLNSGNTQSLSDGAGIKIDRGSASDAYILWDEANDEFDFSHSINLNGSSLSQVQQVRGADGTGWLEFNEDDDDVWPVNTDNLTVLGSVTHMVFAGDSNANATGGNFYWGHGQDREGGGTFTQTASLDRDGDFKITGQLQHDSSLTLNAAGAINLDADNSGNVFLKDNNVTYGRLHKSNDNFVVKNVIYDGQILFQGADDSGTEITSLTLDMSESGAATFINTVTWLGGSSTNANTAYSWGDHSLENYAVTTGDVFTGHMTWQDNQRANFGSDSDLRILHTGSSGFITEYTQDLYLRNEATDRHIYLQADDGVGGLTTYIDIDGENERVTVRRKAYLDGPDNYERILDVRSDATISNQNFYATRFDFNFSGSQAHSADNSKYGLYVDFDSSDSGGDTNNDTRLFPLFIDARNLAGGTANRLDAAYLYARNDGSANMGALRGSFHYGINNATGGTTTNVYGLQSYGYDNTTGSGSVATVYGAYHAAYASGQGSGTLTNVIGAQNIAVSDDTNTKNISAMFGSINEVQLDNTSNAHTINNVYAVYALVDENDADDQHTVNTSYLFFGDYQGSLPTNAFGVYIADDVESRFLGRVRAKEFDVGGVKVIDDARNIENVGEVEGNRFIAKANSVLRSYVSSWSYPTHDLIYRGYTVSTGDYVTLKAAGNSAGPHGVIVAADQGIYFGQTNAETGEVADNDQTTPLDTNWAHIDTNGLDVRIGTIAYSGTTVIDSGRNIINVPTIRLTSSGDAALNSTQHAFQTGSSAGGNIIIDTNEIMARNNGATSDLHLQADGGQITVGNNLDGRITLSPTNDNSTLTIRGGVNDDAILKLLESGTGDVGAIIEYHGENDVLRFKVGNNPPNTALEIDRDTGAATFEDKLTTKDQIRAEVASYASNVNEAYLIASTGGWTGATTNWNTYGIQHRIKTTSGGVPRVTIDSTNGEMFSVDNNGNAIIAGKLEFTTQTYYIRNNEDAGGQLLIQNKNFDGTLRGVRWDAGNASGGAWRPDATNLSNLGLTNRIWNTLYVNNIRFGTANSLLVNAAREITAASLSVSRGTAGTDPNILTINTAAEGGTAAGAVYAGLEFSVTGAENSTGNISGGVVSAIKAIDYRPNTTTYEDSGIGFYTLGSSDAAATFRGGFSNLGGLFISEDGNVDRNTSAGDIYADSNIEAGNNLTFNNSLKRGATVIMSTAGELQNINTIKIPDSDFALVDGNNTGETNIIWRDHSADRLYLGTTTDVVEFRGDVNFQSGHTLSHDDNVILDASRNLTNIASASATSFLSGIGSAASPAYQVGDTDSGFYDSGSNEIGVSLGGASEYIFKQAELNLDDNNLVTTGYVKTGTGSAESPALQVGDDNSGFYDSGANEVGVTLSGALEYEFTPTQFNMASNHLVTSGTITSGLVRVTGTGDASLSSTTHGIQIGASSGQNLLLDNNEVLSRNNGAASTLNLQADGGTVSVGAGTTANLIVSGPISGSGITSTGHITSTGQITTQGNSASAGINIKRTNAGSGGAKGFIAFRDLNGDATASIASIASGGDNNGTLRFQTSAGASESDAYSLSTALTLDHNQNATFEKNLTVSNGELRVVRTGDNFPTFEMARTGGSSKTNQQWDIQIGSTGFWNLKAATGTTYYPIICTPSGDVNLAADTGGANPSVFIDQSNKKVTFNGLAQFTNIDSNGRGIYRNNTGYDLRIGGGTNSDNGAFISVSGDTRGGSGSIYNGRLEYHTGGDAFANQAAILGDHVWYASHAGGSALLMSLDSSTGDLRLHQGDIRIPVARNMYFGGGDDNTYIGEDINDRLRFFTGGSEMLRFTTSATQPVNFYQKTKWSLTDNVANTPYDGVYIDHNISGSQAIAGEGVDYLHRSLIIDLDSSVTTGDTVDEHRVRGIDVNVRVTGDSDSVFGIYSQAEGQHGAGTVSEVTGVYGVAIADEHTSGRNTQIFAMRSIAYGQGQGSGGTTTFYGHFPKVHLQATQDKNVGQLYGLRAEVETDDPGQAQTAGTLYGVRSTWNDDSGGNWTPSNSYLFFGDYTGTCSVSGTKYGVYINNDVRNYFGGFITTSDGSNSAPSYSFNGDTNTGMYSPNNHQLGFSVNGSSRFRLTETKAFFENLTSGITVGSDTGDAFNSGSLLRLQQNANTYVQIKTGTSQQCGLLLGDTSDDFVGGLIYRNSDNHLDFYAGNAQGARLQSNKSFKVYGTTFEVGDGGSNGVIDVKATANAYFKVNGTTRFTLTSGGNATFTGNVTAFSDARLKSDIETLDGSKVYDMRGVSYMTNGKAGSGVIAQELEQVASELVMNNDDGYKSVAYGNLVGYLIEAVKDQKAIIDDLTKRVKELENGND